MLVWYQPNKNCFIFLRTEASRLPPTDAGRQNKQGRRAPGRLWHGAPCCRAQERNPTVAGGERQRAPAEGALGASTEEEHQRGRDRGPGVRLPRGRLRDEQQHAGLHLLPPGQTPRVSAQSAGGAGPLLRQTCECLFSLSEIQNSFRFSLKMSCWSCRTWRLSFYRSLQIIQISRSSGTWTWWSVKLYASILLRWGKLRVLTEERHSSTCTTKFMSLWKK